MPENNEYKVKLSGLEGNVGVSIFFIVLTAAALHILFKGDPDGIDAITKILFNAAGF